MLPASTSLLLIALSSAAATGSSTISKSGGPKVVFFTIESPATAVGVPVLPPATISAFAEEFSESGQRNLRFRGFSIVSEAESGRALVKAQEGACSGSQCTLTTARSFGATYYVTVKLSRPSASQCIAEAYFVALKSGYSSRDISKDVSPCTGDRLLSTAQDLGLELTHGPAIGPEVTVSLTPRTVPNIAIASIPDISRHYVETSTKGRRGGIALSRALQIYQDRYVTQFHDSEGQFRMAQRRRLIGECALRRIAAEPLGEEILEFCEGNSWIWASLGVPAGVLVAWASYPELEQDSMAGFLGFTLGALGAVTSGVLALTYTKFSHSPEEAKYYSPPRELSKMVFKANRQLRKDLGLSEADVIASGLNL